MLLEIASVTHDRDKIQSLQTDRLIIIVKTILASKLDLTGTPLSFLDF